MTPAERYPGRLVDVGEARLHVVETGDPAGPLLVLLHGFPEFWYSWRNQIPALAAAGYRVVAPDPATLRRIDATVLVIWGELDRFLLPELAESPARWASDFRLVRLPHASHWV